MTIIDKRIRMVDDKKSAPVYGFYDLLSEMFHMIDYVKALVRYVGQANSHNEIPKTLKWENATQWNSALYCMTSVEKALPKLTRILRARGRRLVSKATKVTLKLLKNFIVFLATF